METGQTFKLEAAQEREFERMLKRGVYGELFARGLLTEDQKAELLTRLMKDGAAKC